MRVIYILVLFLLIKLSLFGQSKLVLVAELPQLLNETSALISHDNLFWTINDSGGEPTIYGFNRNGELRKEVQILNARNKDWEALAINKTHLFIGDFGNNFGSRKDLTIYAIRLNQLSKQEAKVDFIIQYEYPEQSSWIKTQWKTSYDCEAMVATDTSIFLFTKDWKGLVGSQYELKIQEGKQKANFLGFLNAEGLITDATCFGEYFYFIGYKDYVPIIWKYEKNNTESFLFRKPLEQNYKYQVEGITVVNDTIYVTSENSAINQSLLIYSASE